MDQNHWHLTGRLLGPVKWTDFKDSIGLPSNRAELLLAVKTEGRLDTVQIVALGLAEGSAELVRNLPAGAYVEAEGRVHRRMAPRGSIGEGLTQIELEVDLDSFALYPEGPPVIIGPGPLPVATGAFAIPVADNLGATPWIDLEADEEPPALGPTVTTYTVAMEVQYDGGEPVASPTTFATWLQATLAEWAPDKPFVSVEPIDRITVTLEACQPMELLRKPAEVAVRVVPNTSSAPGCPEVELTGRRDHLLAFIADQWDWSLTDIYEMVPELRR